MDLNSLSTAWGPPHDKGNKIQEESRVKEKRRTEKESSNNKQTKLKTAITNINKNNKISDGMLNILYSSFKRINLQKHGQKGVINIVPRGKSKLNLFHRYIGHSFLN